MTAVRQRPTELRTRFGVKRRRRPHERHTMLDKHLRGAGCESCQRSASMLARHVSEAMLVTSATLAGLSHLKQLAATQHRVVPKCRQMLRQLRDSDELEQVPSNHRLHAIQRALDLLASDGSRRAAVVVVQSAGAGAHRQ